MNHCCKNCHFLTKLHVFKKEEGLGTSFITWDEEDRENFSPLKKQSLGVLQKRNLALTVWLSEHFTVGT